MVDLLSVSLINDNSQGVLLLFSSAASGIIGWLVRRRIDGAKARRIDMESEKSAYDLYLDAIKRNDDLHKEVINLRAEILEIKTAFAELNVKYEGALRRIGYEEEERAKSTEVISQLQIQLTNLQSMFEASRTGAAY